MKRHFDPVLWEALKAITLKYPIKFIMTRQHPPAPGHYRAPPPWPDHGLIIIDYIDVIR